MVARENCAHEGEQDSEHSPAACPAWISETSCLPSPVKGRKSQLPGTSLDCADSLQSLENSGHGVSLEVSLNISSCVQWKLEA